MSEEKIVPMRKSNLNRLLEQARQEERKLLFEELKKIRLMAEREEIKAITLNCEVILMFKKKELEELFGVEDA